MTNALHIEPGAYGIEAVPPTTPGAMVCGECGRAWAEDITPAGRCPWEDDHHDLRLSKVAVRELHVAAGVYTIITDEYGEMSILGDIAEARREMMRRAMRLERDADRIEEAIAALEARS